MAKKDEAGTAVEERKKNLPAELMGEFEADAGQGQENIGRDDVALPFLKLLQSLSPETSKRNEKYVDGAEAGMYLNTITGEIYDGEEGVLIIPCHYHKVWNEWIPRDAGGGFVNSYEDEAEAMTHAEPGNDVVETASHYVLIESGDDQWMQAILPMTSSKLKTSRKLNSLTVMKKMEGPNGKFTPPSFAFMYRLRSVEKENDKGRFFVPVIEDEAVVQDADVYRQAKAFRDVVIAGEAKVDYSKLEESDAEPDLEADAEDDDKPEF